MTGDAESLDRAIQRLRAGDSIGSILADETRVADEFAPLLEIAARLSASPPPPLPAPELVRADRNDFLLEIALLQVEVVSPHPLNRLKDRMVHLLAWRLPIQLFRKKEKWQMSTIAITVTVLLALVMGSVGGVTTLASQSLPGSPIYTMKLFMEETTLFMAPDPETRAEQHLLMFQERSREVQQLALSGEIPDEALINRLELHLRQTLHFADRMEPELQAPFLLRVQTVLREQNQMMTQLAGEVEEPIQVRLEAVNRVMVQADEQIDRQLHERQQEREQQGADESPTPPMQPSVMPPQFRHGNEAGAGTGVEEDAVLQCEDCVPEGRENQYGPQPDEPSPGPGQQGGNPEPCEDCTPAGDEHKYGQADEAVTEPALAAPTVESTTPCQDCEPVGGENQYGQNPDADPPGAPGGNPEPCTDCEPAGDENKHGQTEETVSEPAPEATTVESTTPCQDCEPVGDENQYGQNPDADPPGAPGGNPEPCTDCEPAGDENKHGQTEETVSESAPATDTAQTDDAETAEENSRAENEETGQSAPDTGQSGGGGRSR